MTRTVVVDTNVAVVANRGHEGANEECVNECTHRLAEIYDGEVRLAIDDDYRIIGEYRNNLTTHGELAGSKFFKWVVINQKNTERVDEVPITPREVDDRDFEEFPDHADLKSFDPSDRKFVAVAITHADRPPILQAVDGKWVSWYPALKEVGVEVEFLCVKHRPEEKPRQSGNGQRRHRG